MNNSVKPEFVSLSTVSFVMISFLILGFAIGASIAAVCLTRKKPLLTCFKNKTSPMDVDNICSCTNGVEAIQDACLSNNDEMCIIADSIYQRIHVLKICVLVLMELELPVKIVRQMESVCVQFVIVDII